jgi:hypothetical protein
VDMGPTSQGIAFVTNLSSSTNTLTLAPTRDLQDMPDRIRDHIGIICASKHIDDSDPLPATLVAAGCTP